MVIGSYRQSCAAALVLLTFASQALSQTPASAAPTPSIDLDRSAALDRARIYYESGNYPACIQAFTRLLDTEPQHNNADLKQRTSARTYLAACLLAMGRLEPAREQFRRAILEDRQMETPDPVVFPQAVVDVFIQVRGSLMDALRQEQEEELRRSREEAQARVALEAQERRRIAELERLAATERMVHRNERWMAWVPFGVGQFNNRNEGLGWVFLTAEAALAITAITATSIELGLHSQAQGGQAGLDNRDLTNKLQAARTVSTVAWSACAVVAVVGILEANLSYRAEIPLGERRRPLPDSLKSHTPRRSTPRVTPRLEPTTGGAWLGVGGQF